jgi:hypothetical protein
MFHVSIVLFAIAAVLGATAAIRHLSGKPPILGLALVHGPFAFAGLVVLVVSLIAHGAKGLLPVSAAIFVVAALGGLILFYLHVSRGKLWTPLVLIHGLAAVTAFVLLLSFVLGGGS